jgi:hypothetical protein
LSRDRYGRAGKRTRCLGTRFREAPSEQPVGLFVCREQAERFLAGVRPELAERLRLEPVELDGV